MFATRPLSRSSDARIVVLGLDPIGDVAGVRDDAEHRGIVAVVGRDHLDPAQLAVGALEAVADRLGRARRRAQPFEQRGQRGPVFLVEPEVDRNVGVVFGIEAEEAPRARAAVRDPAALADDRDHVGGVLHERAEAHLALAQRELGPLLIAHVGDDHDRGHDASLRVAQRRDRDVRRRAASPSRRVVARLVRAHRLAREHAPR